MLHNIQKLFCRLSQIGQTDRFDRLEYFLCQSTRCLCYNLFHGDVPHFRSFLQGLNKFYHERRVPAIFICRSAPLGGRSPRLPAARGSLFLPELFYTNQHKDRVKFFWEKSSAGIEWPEFGASFEQDSGAG